MIINPYSFGVAYDPDAQAFFTASGLTGATNLNAVNQLVLDLKAASIWTKMKAIYPMVGGTAALHKWNLKDPRDLDAAFRLVFNGGWTHSSTGAKPNGINAFANTYFNPSLNSLQISHHFSVYLRQSEVDKVPFGCTTIGTGLWGSTIIPRLSNNTYCGINQFGYSPTYPESGVTAAFFLVTRTSNTVSKIFKNTTLKATSSQVSNAPVNANYYIAHWNSPGSITYYSNAENAFTTIGDGLTDAEAANFYTAVQAFNTSLSRQV